MKSGRIGIKDNTTRAQGNSKGEMRRQDDEGKQDRMRS